MNPESVKAILALVPNWLGDVAMCTPALRALRRRFPEARLDVIGRPSACALLEGLPWFERLIPVAPRPGLSDMLRLRRRCGRRAYDLAVVFPHSIRAALLAKAAGARRRLGYARDARSFALTDRVQPYREGAEITPIYMAHEYLGLVEALGCQDDGAGLELCASPKDVEAVRAYLGAEGPVVGIAPGAAFGPSKCWPAESYAAVMDALAERAGAQCVLLTGPGEEETRGAVLAHAHAPVTQCQEDPPAVARLKAAISQVDLLIGNDSGPRHIAIAFRKPVICIMGPTSPRYSEGPWEIGRVLRLDVDCGPCQQPVCATDHRCMTRIKAESVVEAAMEFLPP